MASKRQWAILRIVLGQAQMIGAVVALVFLIVTGMGELTIWAVTFTVAAFMASALFFGRRPE